MFRLVTARLVSMISLSACVKENTPADPVNNPLDTSKLIFQKTAMR